ncbi:MAG TPA: FAD-linked oxidase C-terminal domain-containing protein, partial [Ktedonobacterales bacterium]|nr:FAD-linked oxidase C-terminal domain-containing protein [Ktedonobacterales bacterium]
SVLPSELHTVLETATTMAGEHGLHLSWQADACAGVLQLRVESASAAGGEPPAALCDLAVPPAAVCALAREGLPQVLRFVPPLGPPLDALLDSPSGAAVVVARFPGTPAAVARAVDEARAVAHAHGGGALERLDATTTAACWTALTDFPATADLPPSQALLKVSVLPSELHTVLETATTMAGEHGLHLSWQADACAGVLYLRVGVAAATDGDPAPALGPGLRALQGMLANRWRNAVVLACAPELKADLPLWGADPPGLDVMRTIKRQFDPAGLLNPGRFVGGL